VFKEAVLNLRQLLFFELIQLLIDCELVEKSINGMFAYRNLLSNRISCIILVLIINPGF